MAAGDVMRSAARVRDLLDERLRARDKPGAVSAALDAVREGALEIDALYTLVLGPLLVETGSEWQRGVQSVWEEHFATATVRTIVESLYLDVVATAAKRPRLGRMAVLACPQGEQHDLGLRMLADRMQLAGWDAHFLGADTPGREIAAAAREFDAALVALSVATHYNRILLRRVMDELKRELPGVRIGVGGPAFAKEGTWPSSERLTEETLGLPRQESGDGS